MKKLIPTLLVLAIVLLGCATSGVSEQKSVDFHNMEQRVNNEALKNKSLPPGDGPER